MSGEFRPAYPRSHGPRRGTTWQPNYASNCLTRMPAAAIARSCYPACPVSLSGRDDRDDDPVSAAPRGCVDHQLGAPTRGFLRLSAGLGPGGSGETGDVRIGPDALAGEDRRSD